MPNPRRLRLRGCREPFLNHPAGQKTANLRRRISAILIAANRLDRELLQADAEPLGVAVAVAVGELFVTTLPPGLLTTARWDELVHSTATQKTRHAAGHWAQLQEEYLLRAVPFGSGYLLVAAQQSRIQPFRTALVRLSSGLVLAVLVLTIAVMMGITGRILSPITKLTRAADLLARGQLARSRPLLDEFAERADEVGALARAQLLSTSHLHSVVKTSQRLIRHIEANIAVIDDAAAAVATSAGRQEERLTEVTDTLGPLSRSLAQTSQGLQDAHRILTSLSLSSTAADQMQAILSTAVRRAEALLNYKEKDKDKDGAEPRALRTASVLQQAGVISQAVADQRDVFQKVRESVGLLRSCLDDALSAPSMDPQSGQQAQRAASEIGRLARSHSQESAALHAAAEQLRRGIAEMQKQLSCLDIRSSDEGVRGLSEERLAGASGANRPVGGDPAAPEAAKRRPERARTSPAPGSGLRRSVGNSSSQNLAPVSGTSPERKGAAGQTAGSGTGFKPVGRSSGDHPKVSVPSESLPSGSSFRAIPAAAASGAALSAVGSPPGASNGKGPGSATSIGGSSGNVRPVPAGAGSGAIRLPASPNPSAMSAGGLVSGGAAGRGLPAASATSLGGSSGTVRPVSAGAASGATRLAAAPPSASAVSLGSGAAGGAPTRGLPATSATSIGGSSANLRPVPASAYAGAGKSPAAGVSELGASARSLRALLEGSDSASAQSLNSAPSARRK